MKRRNTKTAKTKTKKKTVKKTTKKPAKKTTKKPAKKTAKPKRKTTAKKKSVIKKKATAYSEVTNAILCTAVALSAYACVLVFTSSMVFIFS